MKELSIEEKAKRYDEAIERSKNYYSTTDSASDIKLIGLIFPELKESEDEKIRKELITHCRNTRCVTEEGAERIVKWISWLEKQGNLMKALQISNAKIGELIEKNYYLKEQLEKQGENNMGISEATKKKLEDNLNKALEKETPESWNKFLDEQGEQNTTIEMITPEESLGINSDTYNKIVDECIYGEQKPADKVEPKFREGDWVVISTSDGEKVVQIDSIEYFKNGKPRYITSEGRWFSNGTEARLWNITKDAKDGDVLVSEYPLCGLGTWYCIFKSLDGDESMTVYCYLARDGRFETKKELCFDKDPYNTKPATKEQRDQLEKAMSDAGYKWDAENKQLRKIESRQEELTEFEKAVKQVIEEAIECGDTHNLKADADMLLRLVQKPWSEEDIELLDNTIKFIEDSVAATPPSLRTYSPTLTGKEIPFLKALKERYTWRPSKREKEALLWCVVHLGGADKQTLGELLEALNKL